PLFRAAGTSRRSGRSRPTRASAARSRSLSCPRVRAARGSRWNTGTSSDTVRVGRPDATVWTARAVGRCTCSASWTLPHRLEKARRTDGDVPPARLARSAGTHRGVFPDLRHERRDDTPEPLPQIWVPQAVSAENIVCVTNRQFAVDDASPQGGQHLACLGL